jgi:hypothetical protein
MGCASLWGPGGGNAAEVGCPRLYGDASLLGRSLFPTAIQSAFRVETHMLWKVNTSAPPALGGKRGSGEIPQLHIAERATSVLGANMCLVLFLILFHCGCW